MLGAIVSFSDAPRSRFGRARTEIRALTLPVEGRSCLLFLLPYTAEAFLALSLKCRCKLLQKLAKQLEKRKVACVYADKLLSEQLAGNFYMPDGRRIFSAVAGYIIERHCKTFSLSPESTRVCIYEAPTFTEAGAKWARSMIMRTKQLVLVSPDDRGAEDAASAMFEEYGLAAHVTQQERQMNRANIVLLLSVPPREVLADGLILDLTGQYPHCARRDYYFETAFGYAELLPYFGKADCRAAEFMLLCCDAAKEGAADALAKIGWCMKKA